MVATGARASIGAGGAGMNSRLQQKEETRQRVYEAALEVFRRDGVETARIDDIATAAGVSRGTFYFHFPTKEDVLAQLLAESEQQLVGVLAALPSDAALGTVLATVARAMAEPWQNEPRLFLDVAVVALRRIAARGPQMQDPVRDVIGERFRGAAGRGELSSVLPPETLADLYLLNSFAAAMAWCANPGVPLESVLHGVTTVFMHGAIGAGTRP